MKRPVTLLLFIFASVASQAQFLDHLKNKINQKINEKVDRTIDEAGSGKKPSSTPATLPPSTSTPAGTDGSAGQGTDHQDTEEYSKFDFIPGEKIIVSEDFSQDAIGEFPARWNTKTTAEVVTIKGRPGKWLSMKKDGVFFPEFVKTLPSNFTLQVDLLTNEHISAIAHMSITLAQTASADEKFSIDPTASGLHYKGITLNITPLGSGPGNFSYATKLLGFSDLGPQKEFLTPSSLFATLSVWRQNQRVRVYLNGTKMLDLPRAIEADALINSLVFAAYEPDYDRKGGAFYLSNIRLAVGAPDLRNKIVKEGKFITHGIQFDTNSDVVKPESHGVLAELASTLADNPALKLKIVGFTDNDGDDRANLDLSKRRAAAVKAMLVADYAVSASRLETDGKGRLLPIAPNTTAEGKANNRRVEFLKI